MKISKGSNNRLGLDQTYRDGLADPMRPTDTESPSLVALCCPAFVPLPLPMLDL